MVLILMVVEVKTIALDKSNGLNINSDKFCRLPIHRGENALICVKNFLLTRNANVLDEIEVQIMKKRLPDGISGKDKAEGGCCTWMEWSPLNDQSINEFPASEDGNNIEKQNNGYNNA